MAASRRSIRPRRHGRTPRRSLQPACRSIEGEGVVPALDLGDDGVGVGGPDEGLGSVVVLGEIAVDRGLEVDERVEHAALQPSPGELGEEGLDRVEPGAEVGVKWKVQRGWRASQARTLGCLWVA